MAVNFFTKIIFTQNTITCFMLKGDVDVQKIKEIFAEGERKKIEFCKKIDTAVALEAGHLIIDSIINETKQDPVFTSLSKTCNKCGETKPITEFNKSVSNRDKLQNECGECHKKYMHEYRRRIIEQNKEKNKKTIEKLEKNEQNYENAEQITKKYEQTVFDRAPPNTALFLTWIEKKDVFNINDFINAYSYIDREHAEKIVYYQILKHRIAQIGRYKFKVVLPKMGV